MARTGLYHSDVKKARDALLVQGRHPSVDAVRVALGNTGSKTTIHKYLKELDAEEGDRDGRKVSISDALQDIVARLAARLHDEAQERIAAIEKQLATSEAGHAALVIGLQQEMTSLKEQLRQDSVDAEEAVRVHEAICIRLQAETLSRHTLQQQVVDLQERLVENEAHRQSIEEKHTHARNSLEHYRQSVKEQREQDLRRHEQQLQEVQAELRHQRQAIVQKQEEATRLNHEGARLVATLSQVEKSLHEEQTAGRRLTEQIAASQSAARQVEVVLTQVAGNERLIETLRQQLAQTLTHTELLSNQSRALEVALEMARTALVSQHEIIRELRGRDAKKVT